MRVMTKCLKRSLDDLIVEQLASKFWENDFGILIIYHNGENTCQQHVLAIAKIKG
jgi:hypothetical protein